MLAYLKILRLHVCALSVFAVLVGSLVSRFYNPFYLLLASLTVFLFTGAGNVLNDYFDYEIDKINRPKRILPQKKISLNNALYYSIILFAISSVLVFFLNLNNILLFFFNLFITVIYSWRLKGIPLIGNLSISWLAASAFLFGSFLAGGLSAAVVILALMAFSGNTGKEITKAIDDVKGDKKAGLMTLPVATSSSFAAWIASIFVLFAILFSPIPYFFRVFNIFYLIIVIIADIVYAASCFLAFISVSRSWRIMRIGSFIAMLAFLVGSL